MWPDEAQLVLRKSTKFQTIHSPNSGNQHEDDNLDTDTLGGIIFEGKLGWVANGAYLEVITIDSGNKLAVFDFDRILSTTDSYISCISEIHIAGVKSCCLAVGLQLSSNGGKICIVSIQGSCILGMIDFFDKVTTCHYVPKRQSDHSLRSLLRCFDGCLAVGTDQGKVILLDMCFKRCKYVIDELMSSEDNLETQQCHIIFANADPEEIMEHHEQSKQDDIYFGIQLEVLENARNVQSIVVIPYSMTLVVGLDDGRMVLYDLENLQAFHLAYPPEKAAPLLYLSYLEPADDPRACIYVWALHASKNGGIGVMHSIMFQHKYIDRTETVYRNFLSCSPRLTMPMHEKSSCPIACHSISKLVDEEEEQQVTLCAIAWITKTGGMLMVFDLNQWYKEQMPEVGDWRRFPSYTATFPMGELCPLDLSLDPDMISQFNSIQRPEEHFYPNSLSFDVSILTKKEIMLVSWPGLQKLVLDNLVKSASKAILEPSKYVKEMINAALVPQYQDFNVNLPMGIDLKREFLLTIALEYNCVTFLKKVAMAIADGSHIGNVPTEALGLSTITDWIWNRARSLKDTSNNFSIPLFDYSGRTIDCGMQKSLTLCTRQLRVVANLMELIVTECQQFIPEHVHKILLEQLQSIQLASDYQEAIQWLLNVGLLPEGVWRSDSHVSSQPDEPIFVPYPFHLINSYYSTQRMKLSLDQNYSNGPSPFVYIDTFIEYCCDMQAIRDLWKEQGASGLYPPGSLQNMLRVLLIPEIPIEAKQVLFVYLFMDINHVLSDGRYAPVVQNLIKFPAVFKMDPATIKVTQSFWYLDHGDLDTAVEELISPLSQSHNLKQWQRDFLITTLLKQDSPHLALRILKAPGVPVKPSLELKTLLANDLVSEAFKFQRAKGDKNLLMQFFEGTMQIQKRDLLLDLSLNEEESKVLVEFLNKAKISLTENLHFVYLLQRSDFVDAVSLVDKLMKSQQRDRSYDLNVPREILTIYHTTLEPTSKQLTFLAYTNPEKFQLKKFKEKPSPLSSSLIQQKLDPSAGIYQRSILSVKEAGSREMFEDDVKHEQSLPFLRRSGLGTFSFVQKTQSNNVVYPEIVDRKQKTKRQLDDKEKYDIDFTEYEGPRKRRRLDESELPRKSIKDYDVSVLERFNPKTKPKFNFTEGNLDSMYFGAHNLERTPEKMDGSKSISPSTLLRTPIVEKAHVEGSPDRHRFTPQSILKSASHASLPRSTTPLSYVSRKSFDSEDPKSIRFAIPGNSSVDTSFNSSVLQISNQTLETTQNKTIDDSIVSKDEFFSPDVSVQGQDQTMKESIHESTQELNDTEEKDETIDAKIDVSEGHEDFSFLANAPQPRPPIRSSSRNSQESASGRNSRSNSRSVSPTFNKTRSKSREIEEKQPESPEVAGPSNLVDNASTPIASLTQKRSQKSLGRAVLEKNLKQSLMTDIFGEYSKNTSQLEETDANISSVSDSDINFLSYEQSGILTGDTLVDQQIIKKMIGNETIASLGEPTMGDSTLRLLNASSTILSDSSNYEDSRDDLNTSEIKETSVEKPQVVQITEEIIQQDEPEPMETEVTEELQEKIQQKSSEAISIGDSDESFDEDETEHGSDDTESEDKFANKSESEKEEDPPNELEDTEEYYEEEQSILSHDTSYGESSTASEPSTEGKPEQRNDSEVISIGSTSDEDIEEDETPPEIPPMNLSLQPPEVELSSYYHEQSTANQGLIMSHMETAHDIPESYTASQSLLYLDVDRSEFQPQSQMNEAQMSQLLYDEVETDNDSMNLAIVEDESISQEVQIEIPTTEENQEVPVIESQEVVEEVQKTEDVQEPKKVKTKVIEVKKSEVANARMDIIKEVYDETVVQEVPAMIEDDEDQSEVVVDEPEVQEEVEIQVTEHVEEEIVVDEDVEEQEIEVQEEAQEVIQPEIDEPLQVDDESNDAPMVIHVEETEPEQETNPEEESKPQDESIGKAEEAEIQEWLKADEVVEQQEVSQNEVIVESEEVAQPEEVSHSEENREQEEVMDLSQKSEEKEQKVESSENQMEIVEDPVTEEVVETIEEKPQEIEKPSKSEERVENLPVIPSTSTEPIEKTPEPKPSTSSEKKIDNRKSLYPQDPLDYSSIIPQSDDGVEIDVLNKSNLYENLEEKVDELETLPRKLRSRAQSFDQKPSALDSPVIKRNLRATSVPKSAETQETRLTPRKSRRISVDTQLEQIQEGTPLDVPSTPKRRSIVAAVNSGTPSMLTRSASRRLSTETMQEPTTPSRNTRAASKERTRITTRRITDNIEEVATEDEAPIARRTRATSVTTDENDDNRSEISVKSTRSTTIRRATSERASTRSRKASVSSSTDTSPVFEEENYSQSRRLTRRQQAMMEKLSQASTSSVVSKVDEQSEDVSDTESIAESVKSTTSNVSKRSTASKRSTTKVAKVTKSKSVPAKRSTRSNSKPEQEIEEVGTRKRKATKPLHLETIPEDDKPSNKSTTSEEPEVPEEPEIPVKRTRKATKKQK